MFDSILDSVKGEITKGLTDKLGLSNTEVEKTLSSTKEAFSKTMASETKSNGINNLTNLFSNDDNSKSSNDLLSSLGGNLISSLSSNGFNFDKAGSIKDIVIPEYDIQSRRTSRNDTYLS